MLLSDAACDLKAAGSQTGCGEEKGGKEQHVELAGEPGSVYQS